MQEQQEKRDPKHLFTEIPEELNPPDPDSPRGRILAAARRLFAENGFDGTSTRSIAKLADVNLAMIHYYFGTKRALFKQMLKLEFFRLFSLVQQRVFKVDDLPGTIISFSLELTCILHDNPDWARIAIAEIADNGGIMLEIVREIGESGPKSLLPLAKSAFRESVSEGKIIDLPFPQVMMFLIALAYGTIFIQPLFEEISGVSLQNEATWKKQLQVNETLLRRGLFAEEKAR